MHAMSDNTIEGPSRHFHLSCHYLGIMQQLYGLSFSSLVCFLSTCLLHSSLFWFCPGHHMRVWDTKLNKTWASRRFLSRGGNTFLNSQNAMRSVLREHRGRVIPSFVSTKGGLPEEGPFSRHYKIRTLHVQGREEWYVLQRELLKEHCQVSGIFQRKQQDQLKPNPCPGVHGWDRKKATCSAESKVQFHICSCVVKGTRRLWVTNCLERGKKVVHWGKDPWVLKGSPGRKEETVTCKQMVYLSCGIQVGVGAIHDLITHKGLLIF